jgi:exopolyphosphatase/guanosine-5'-triphosphate,3'-diphosphate pyrophosphatase
MRLAAIDIGTNSIHVVIAQASGKGGFEVLDREREVVQVGRGSFASGRLRKDAIARAVESLARFVALARRMGVERIACTATAAVREAKNGGDFVSAARAVAGITPRVIPAREEGRLIYLAVKAALPLPAAPSLILDIGGGSLQMVVGDREKLLRVVSAPLGALRLAELHPLGEPPRAAALAALRRVVRKLSKPGLETVREYEPAKVFGSSGSIHALAHVTQALEGGKAIRHLNGHFLEIRALARTVRALEGMTVAERGRLPGIDPARAEILVHGGIVLLHVLAGVGADGITMSDYGVREGLLVDDIARHAKEISRLDAIDDLRLRSVHQLLARFRGDEAHARHVADLSLALFDGLRLEHHLDDDARRMLEYAALLHDIGSIIAHERHTEHAYYIIKNGGLRGLPAEEVELVAAVARYHGKARPKKGDRAIATLGREARRSVRWLAALLRIAEALDRSQYQLVRGVRVSRAGGALTLRLAARENARLELWAARERVELLSKLLRRPVRIVFAAPPPAPVRKRSAARKAKIATRKPKAAARSKQRR